MNLRNTCFGLIGFFSLPAAAQQPAGTTDTVGESLREVVVTAQRSKQQNIYVPYSVSTLSAQYTKEFHPRTSPDALMSMPGVFVQRTNLGGGSPFVRGLTGNQTLILVDGIRLNNSTFRYGPNQYLNTIDAYTIRRVEVARGTGSVQYGTDAMGGVIQVFTKEPSFTSGKPVVNGMLSGKYMTGGMEKTARGEAQYSGKRTALLAGISKRDFGDIRGGDTTGKQTPSGYDEWAFDIKARFLLKKNITLLLANQFLQQQHVPVYHKVQLENYRLNEMDPQQRFLGYAKLLVAGHSVWNKETEITISFQQGLEGRNSQKNGSTILRKEKDRVRTAGITADILSAFTRNWTANSGMEIYMDKVASNRQDVNTVSGEATAKRGLYPDASVYGNYSLYSLQHFRYGHWLLDAGLRFNTFSVRIRDTSLGNVRITPSALVGNTALMYILSQQQSVYITFSSGYRAPNVDDMGTLGIVDFRYELPSAGLRPEKSAHTELGYKIQHKGFSGTAALFYMHLSDLITRVKEEGQVINGYPVYRKENSEAAFIRGAEFSISYQVVKALRVNGGLACTYGQNLTRNEPLRRMPPMNGRLMTLYRETDWYMAAEMQFAAKQNRLAQGDKEDNRIPVGGTPGWAVYHLYGGYKTKSVQFSAGLQNIFNKDYRTHGSGINGLGRSGWIAVSFQW
ncbi:MAG: TonB-dependent receptor [Sphingobacteriales bacterium]|nr:TonB-dependent receptor [Sphingobacteriales bacterium]